MISITVYRCLKKIPIGLFWAMSLNTYGFIYFPLVKINHLVWTIFQESRRPSFLWGCPLLIDGNHQPCLRSACCTCTHTLPMSLSCVNINLTKWRSHCLFCSSRFSHGEHNMALVRGASSFWLKETASTVWDSFFMGRYPDGSNEAFLLTTHLLKIPHHHQA